MLTTADVAAAEAEELRQSRSWLRGLLVPKVLFGLVIVVFFLLLAFLGPLLYHTSPDTTSALTLRPPSPGHLLGTTQQGQDVLAQVIYGARISMEVGLAAGVLTTLWAVLVGLTGGYIAGAGSELLSMFSNVFLVLPALPLVVILASYLPNSGSVGVILVITVTGWAWGARVLRAQTLSLRRRDFVEAARATGESSFKIMLYDILPNELAIIAATFLASVVGAILTEASIAFLGLSNVTQWSWGTILYWAQVSGAELARAWWWFVPPGLCIALVGTGLAFINFGIDDVINPRLRSSAPATLTRRDRLRLRLRPKPKAEGARPAADPGAPAEHDHQDERVPVLALRHLSVEYGGSPVPVRAVSDVTLTLHRGQVLGIAGESGSGKSTLARTVTRLLRPPAAITGGEMIYTSRSGQQIDITGLSGAELRKFRWEEISIVFQSAMNALNPVLTLGAQVDDVLHAHRPQLKKVERAARTRELLQLVGISPDRAGAYPHELSGGMRQRAMIAMGLALDPEIIVMDEPTTALDVVIQRQVIETIGRLKDRLGFSVIFITHDLSLLIELCDTIAIMYAGQIVELAPADQLYRHPQHPYSQGLLGSFPTLTGPRRSLTGVPGYPPDLRRRPPGCQFQPRCPKAFDRCTETIPLLARREDAEVACFLYDKATMAGDHG
ncbi:MAG TPA: dipeptide/oligopeptide/nickel ABC transporter permease/ATP-binding protein [Streptosporangiaceae bacterium]|nr:dipeptide/oligopeptide/nickel ABC transporter permease/ATP-binding protein [Streptosporangiaceae bacterium]